MKVLIIHTIIWSHYKGQIYSELFRQISESGHSLELKVIHMAASERSRANLGAPDLSIHAYPYEILYNGFIEDLPLQRRFRLLMSAIRAYKPDIINVPGYYDPAVILIMIYCRLRGIKIILSNDSTADDHRREGWRELLKRKIINLADGYFCYGSKSAAYMLQMGVRPEQILQRRNAVNNKELRTHYEQATKERQQQQQQLGLRRRNLIFVGRLIDQLKNISGLIKAYAYATHHLPAADDWGMMIVGNGDDKSRFEALATELHLEGVKFLPGGSWEKIPAYLALADVLVLPSFSEPWGLVVNEAMACGLPVLVSEQCGCAADLVLPGQNGYTFNAHSVEQLAQHLRLVMDGTYPISDFGRKSQELIKEYSPEKVAREMMEGFLTVLTKTV